MELKSGDVVMLKSGGPEMTVLRVLGETENNRMDEVMRMRGYEDGDVLCDWEAEGSTTRPRKVFKAAMLMNPNAVEEEEPSDEASGEEEAEDLDFDDEDFDF